ncbi:hypothetical protein [Vibrio algarum]|uniref:Uncharacterized protein n=1 Tax=Vibrio algarum TaxID=3020714 RepID=A0ABT4YW34_9VIBR|nr:hypothetical protein [Vibrio sp. KJ40-1]MDB1125797.1 hypothetical protein [Vibrio sp. KJ40-1]
MKVQANVSAWFIENPHINESEKVNIEKEISLMMADIYSDKATSWQDNELIRLIKQTKKKGRAKKTEQQSLAQL